MPSKCLAAALLFAGLATQHTMVMFHYPRWSPDGKWIVLTTNVDGPDEEVWLVSPDGKTRRKLTDNDVGDSVADWHPDGRRIVFSRGDHSQAAHFVMNMDGSNVQPYVVPAPPAVGGRTVIEKLTKTGQDVILKRPGEADRTISTVSWTEQPSFSPDGTLVVWEQRATAHDIPSSDIAIWDSRSGAVRVIARGTDPSWSPDGRLLLFKTPDKNRALFITTANVATGETRTLTQGVHPHWSPDGTRILYMADSQDRADAYIIGVSGGEPRCLTCDWK